MAPDIPTARMYVVEMLVHKSPGLQDWPADRGEWSGTPKIYTKLPTNERGSSGKARI